MKGINVKLNPMVKMKFESYPKNARMKLTHVRDLIVQAASKIEGIRELEETLKWGEPSYTIFSDIWRI